MQAISSEVEACALANYENYFGLPAGSATLPQVAATSAGIHGFALASAPPPTAAGPSTNDGMVQVEAALEEERASIARAMNGDSWGLSA